MSKYVSDNDIQKELESLQKPKLSSVISYNNVTYYHKDIVIEQDKVIAAQRKLLEKLAYTPSEDMDLANLKRQALKVLDFEDCSLCNGLGYTKTED